MTVTKVLNKKASELVEMNRAPSLSMPSPIASAHHQSRANPSGIQPTEYKVLIAPKDTEAKTKGGIILPDATKERDQHAQMEGVIVAVSPLAFTYDSWKDGAILPPQPGDAVLFAKYSGAVVTGRDGKEYRIVNDKDIAAVLT